MTAVHKAACRPSTVPCDCAWSGFPASRRYRTGPGGSHRCRSLVGQHGTGIAVALLHQVWISGYVMGFALAEYRPNGQTHRVATEVDLGAEPVARSTERLVLHLGGCAGGAAMRPDDGAVDHLQHVQSTATCCQRLNHQVPDARLAPAAELLPHGVPLAERHRQVAPRRSGPANPQYVVSLWRWLPGGRPPRVDSVVRNGAKIAHSSSVISPRITVGLKFTKRPVKIDRRRSFESLGAKKQRKESR